MGYASSKFQKKPKQERPWKVHPVWRGIGCIMILIILVMAWVGADVFLKTQTIFNLSPNMRSVILIPYTKVALLDQFITGINRISADAGLTNGQVLFSGMFIFLGFGVLYVIYAAFYRMAGPPRYGPMDEPPIPPRRRDR